MHEGESNENELDFIISLIFSNSQSYCFFHIQYLSARRQSEINTMVSLYLWDCVSHGKTDDAWQTLSAKVLNEKIITHW